MESTVSWNDIGTLVCDLDGVVYLDDLGIPGAGDALAAVVAVGIRLVFVTNNSTKTPQQVAAKIQRTTGFTADPAMVITSSRVTAGQLAGTVDRALVVGGDAIDAALEEVGIAVVTSWEDAAAVVVGLDPGLTYEKLAGATLAIRNGAGFYATNTDATYPTPRGLLPGGGAMVAALQTATAVAPVVAGKPEAPMVAEITKAVAGPVLVVGDRPETDVALARAAGWSSALVLSGVTRSLTEVPAEWAPDVVLGSLADVAEHLVAARHPD